MRKKPHNGLLIISLSLVMLVAIPWALTPSPVLAQCGSDPPPDSTCYTCHILDRADQDESLWHGIHASKDCCARCHGGNCQSMDEDLAHQGIVVNPLNDIYTNCHSCHPDDYLARAEVFAAELGVTPVSSPTSTPATALEISVPKLVILPAPAPITPSISLLPLVLGGLAILTFFLLGLILLITHFRN
jgi:hypothetical protein